MLFVIFELMKINIRFKDLGTNEQYDHVIEQCEEIFLKKTRDYGTAWRVLRSISIVDQIYIKAQRIRNIQETGTQKVEKLGDDIRSEFIGMINYSIIGLIQMELTDNDPEELDPKTTETYYHKYFLDAKNLMQSKNHDYGEAWRNMGFEGNRGRIRERCKSMRKRQGHSASLRNDRQWLWSRRQSLFKKSS